MRVLLLTSLVLSLAGCRLAPFSELEDDATVVTLTPGNGYPQGGYGSVLTAYEGTLEDGTAVARVAISAGPGTPFGVHDAWHAGELGNFGRRFEGCDEIGTDTPDCDAGASAALAHLPQWQGRRDCLIYSAVNVGLGATPGEGRLRIKCESTASGMTPLMQVEGVGYGTSLASMPAGSVHGPVLVGAPGAENVGQIHRLPPDGIATAAIPLPDVGLTAGARLGTALATAPHTDAAGVGLDSDAVLIAAAAPGASRVVLYAMGLFTDPLVGGDPALTVRALACLDGVRVRSPYGPLDDGFALTLGDTNADGVAELFVGTTEGVRMLRVSDAGDGLGGGVGCTSGDASDDPTTTILACPTGTDATCDGFGASLAVGDANHDGTNDLLVGAPRSITPEGTTGAGFVLRGTPTGPTTEGAVALYVAGLSSGAFLGEEAAFVRTGTTAAPRYEPVLGAPGEHRVFAFLCSGLPGDAVADGGRCQPL